MRSPADSVQQASYIFALLFLPSPIFAGSSPEFLINRRDNKKRAFRRIYSLPFRLWHYAINLRRATRRNPRAGCLKTSLAMRRWFPLAGEPKHRRPMTALCSAVNFLRVLVMGVLQETGCVSLIGGNSTF
jgi:hypothetical protein